MDMLKNNKKVGFIGGGVGCHLIGCEELVSVIDEAQETLQSSRKNVEFEIPRTADTMFFPKAKHRPKGHERGYKFHK